MVVIIAKTAPEDAGTVTIAVELATISNGNGNGNGNKELKLTLIFYAIMFAFVLICFYNLPVHFFDVSLVFRAYY